MGIRFFCPNGHKMNVKAHLAGKTGFCPECGARMKIPFEDTRPSSKSGAGQHKDAGQHKESRPSRPEAGGFQDGAAAGIDRPNMAAMPSTTAKTLPVNTGSTSKKNPLLLDQTLIWYLQIPGGTQYGPVDSLVVSNWIRERRVAPEMLVWREDWPEWKEARLVFPEILQ